MRREHRAGMTIVELIVALSILAALIAIVVPAVLAARESSRRAQCLSHLKDFGIALHGFEATMHSFPAAQRATMESPTPVSLHFYAPHVYLLPFFDQGSVSATIDTRRPQSYLNDPAALDENAKVAIPAFQCPSDENSMGTNYRFCLGTGPGALGSSLSPGGNGPFEALRVHSSADIRDGLSMTIAVSERVQGGGNASRFTQDDSWYSGITNILHSVPPVEQMIHVCDSLQGQPSEFQPYGGKTWYIAAYDYTWYNHAVTPNSKGFDCSAQSLNSSATKPGDGVYKASSKHAGGVNCVFMDGHTRFVSNSIDLAVWRALSTRSASEAISDSQF